MAKVQNIAFSNDSGEVVRLFAWDGREAELIQTKNTKRLQLCSNPEILKSQGIEYICLGKVTATTLKGGMKVDGFGRLEVAKEVENTVVNLDDKEESNKLWRASFGSVALIVLLFMTGLLNMEYETPELEEELKEHAAKLVKRQKIEPRKVTVTANISRHSKRKEVTKKITPKKRSVKRMGALAVLGQLNKGKSKGGLNLGAVKATAGPGLGGTAGSGGVQTSLYGKGLIAAPVGPGANIRGGGGYGTKGKGGGKAGYGKLTLVGSSGSSTIPLGRESIVDGGLDRDLIASVIQKNLGQIRFCYEKGLQTNPKLGGRVAVDFTINAAGRVQVANVNNTTLHSKIVEDCILLRLRTWKFPLPEGGVKVKVSYPFLLRRLGSS